MAPRATKAKKTAVEVKADSEVTKKGKSKGKQDIDLELPEVELEGKVQLETKDTKVKRGKKAAETNGHTETNGVTEKAPAVKKGRKKAEPVPEENGANGDVISDKEQSPDVEVKEETTNGHPEEVANAKGKKKPKKEATEKAEPKSRAKKNANPEPAEADKESVQDEKEKPKARGRGRKPQAKTEKTESDGAEEEVAEPIPKGKKKPAAKSAKKRTPEPEEDKSEGEAEKLEDKKTEDEKESIEDSHKPDNKNKKGKKTVAKPTETNEAGGEEPVSKKKKTAKKDGKGDSKDDTPEPTTETKPAKGKRAPKKQPEALEDSDEPEEGTTKRKRKIEEKAPAEAKKKPALKNKATTNYDEIDFTSDSTTSQGKEWNFKIASWNVDGIRAWLTKGGLEYIRHEKPDILCLQEVKCSKDKLPDEAANIPGYHAYWLCSEKDGYAGVGIYTTKLAMSVQYGLDNEQLDSEGRIITAEYEEFYLVCTYVPNAGRGLVTLPKRLEWNDAFSDHVKVLDKKKPVIICGDMNVAHNEIDLANPKTNRKNAGFTPEERAGMTALLAGGLVDAYRHRHPDRAGAYTFWTYMMNSRAKNTGWRLDYFLVSERLLPAISDSVIRSEVYGSDHCPIALFLHLTSAEKPKGE